MEIFEKILFLIGGLFFLVIGMLLLLSFIIMIDLFRQHKKRRIGSINPGEKVLISGYVDHNPKLYSPVTQRECAAWEIYVDTQSGKSRKTLLHLYSNENIIMTDEFDIISLIIGLDTPLKTSENELINSVVKISKKPSFQDNQNTFSKFRDQRTYDFLEEHNFEKINYLGLRHQLTIKEKTLVPGDKIFAWGEVIMDGNQKLLKSQLVSDSLIMEICKMIGFLFMGFMFTFAGLNMCRQVFI
ncbi:MAG: hypothetical protein F6K62_24370 [Sphaerospermopsis sp. SIO1G2]|nr:hypothetical protein [Sphaerospermopsis sp. SIO1G2]